jgi:hypothetical protein
MHSPTAGTGPGTARAAAQMMPAAPEQAEPTESEALRLRRALEELRLSLSESDDEVVELIERWQDSLDSCEGCERRLVKLNNQVEAQKAQLEEWRQYAGDCFRAVAAKLASTARNAHVHTAPFVTIDHQQALQLHCWLLEGRSWRPVRLSLGGGQLAFTKSTRSRLTRRLRQVKVAIDLDWIEGASGDGDVLVSSGCCSVEARWQWSLLLGPVGREVFRARALTFSCETESGMDFWPREVHAAKGLPPPLARVARSQVYELSSAAPAKPRRKKGKRSARAGEDEPAPFGSTTPTEADMLGVLRGLQGAAALDAPVAPVASPPLPSHARGTPRSAASRLPSSGATPRAAKLPPPDKDARIAPAHERSVARTPAAQLELSPEQRFLDRAFARSAPPNGGVVSADGAGVGVGGGGGGGVTPAAARSSATRPPPRSTPASAQRPPSSGWNVPPRGGPEGGRGEGPTGGRGMSPGGRGGGPMGGRGMGPGGRGGGPIGGRGMSPGGRGSGQPGWGGRGGGQQMRSPPIRRS